MQSELKQKTLICSRMLLTVSRLKQVSICVIETRSRATTHRHITRNWQPWNSLRYRPSSWMEIHPSYTYGTNINTLGYTSATNVMANIVQPQLSKLWCSWEQAKMFLIIKSLDNQGYLLTYVFMHVPTQGVRIIEVWINWGCSLN